jgi:hypothetical protein
LVPFIHCSNSFKASVISIGTESGFSDEVSSQKKETLKKAQQAPHSMHGFFDAINWRLYSSAPLRQYPK